MGTNYYLIFDECEHCGHSANKRHIGKSSNGWHFALHVYPEDEINSLSDWTTLWEKGDAEIQDEYGKTMGFCELLEIIEKREGLWPPTKQFCQNNHCFLGLNNLASCEIDGKHCIGHGKGTWDLCIGEFS